MPGPAPGPHRPHSAAVPTGSGGAAATGAGSTSHSVSTATPHGSNGSLRHQPTRAVSMVDPGPMVISTPMSPGRAAFSSRSRS